VATKRPFIALDGTGDVVTSDFTTAITGDLDVRAQICSKDWTHTAIQTIVAHHAVTATNRAWAFLILTNGKLRLTVYPADGTTAVNKDSTVALHTAAELTDAVDKIWVRAHLDVDNGASGFDVKFYYSTNGVQWTQLGTTVTTATAITGWTPVAATAFTVGALANAALSFIGRIYKVLVYAGTVLKVNPDFTNYVWGTGDSANDDAIGNTWTLTNAKVVAYENDLNCDMPFELEVDPPVVTGSEPVSLAGSSR